MIFFGNREPDDNDLPFFELLGADNGDTTAPPPKQFILSDQDRVNIEELTLRKRLAKFGAKVLGLMSSIVPEHAALMDEIRRRNDEDLIADIEKSTLDTFIADEAEVGIDAASKFLASLPPQSDTNG